MDENSTELKETNPQQVDVESTEVAQEVVGHDDSASEADSPANLHNGSSAHDGDFPNNDDASKQVLLPPSRFTGFSHDSDYVSASRDLLSSPTASRVGLGFGSLDIILETDQRPDMTTKDGPSTPDDNPPRWGWVVVIASWIVMIPVAGVLASFGTLISALTSEFNATKLEAGWIGSLSFGFTVGVCPFSTPLFNVFGARKVAFAGVVGGSVCLVVTSFTPILHLMFLTYSAMYGTCANFVYNTAMNLTGKYFPNKHQALATCLASAGISFGTLLVNPLATSLESSLGWRNTLRVMAGFVLVIGIACVATFKPVKTPEEKVQTKLRHAMSKSGNENSAPSEALIDKAVGSKRNVDIEAVTESLQHMHTESRVSLAAKEIQKNVLNKSMWDCSVCLNPTCILWMLGTLFWSVSFLFPFIFLIDYMGTINIPKSSSAWVMTAYGISEFAGRLFCALAAGKIRFSLTYVYAGSAAFVGAATLLAPQGTSLGVMYAYGIAAGINAGILNALMFVTTMQLFGNEQGTHVWGYINVMLALGMVVGPVAAGGIFDATQSYESAFYMGGSLFLVCGIVMLLIPLAQRHFRQPEREAAPVEVKVTSRNSGSSPRVTKNGGSIVKPGSLRKLALQQRASKASKFNGDVKEHLQALEEIEEQMLHQDEHVTPPQVTVTTAEDNAQSEQV